MSKIYINSDELKYGCIVPLKDTIDDLDKVIDYFDYFDIPSGFSRKAELRNVKSDLRTIKSTLNDAKNWIIDSNNDYNSLLEKLNDKNAGLSNYSIRNRNNIV